MKVLIVGSGGREHALGYKIKESTKVSKLYFAPGNAGTLDLGENVDIPVTDIHKLKAFALEQKMDLTVVGPELPLTLGIVDTFKAENLLVFGPGKAAARLEGSKAFSKAFMKKHEIPTAAYEVFDDLEKAREYILEASYPLVIKADGLAAGKGVLICNTLSEAEQVLEDLMTNKIFGEGGTKVVIEEFLQGKEVSLLCLTDGKTILPLDSASDYKRAFDNDLGLNTGGMGSISPSPYYGNEADEIVAKTLLGIQQEALDYNGVIYIGLMLTADGPKVIEYNARFGDPETEALLPRLESDLFEHLYDTAAGRLSETKIRWADKVGITVIMASQGYPEAYEVGEVITLPALGEDRLIFHCGTRAHQGQVLSNGGRVLAITALAATFEEARIKAYETIDKIRFNNSFYRKDIGEKR